MFDFCQVIHSFAKLNLIDKDTVVILFSQRLVKMLQVHQNKWTLEVNLKDMAQILSICNHLGIIFENNPDFK